MIGDNLSLYYYYIDEPHLQVCLSRFLILQNGLQVNDFYLFFCQVNGGLEDTYEISNCVYYIHNISKF